MISIERKARFLQAGGLAALLLLCGCAKAPEAGVIDQAKNALPPPILPPSEVTDPAAPPSYEVGIATAAADRNHAKAKCAEMTERLREVCEADATATFASAEAELQDLRGNQQ